MFSPPPAAMAIVFALMASALQLSAGEEPDIRSHEGRRLSAPAVQEKVGRIGFSVKAIHVHSVDNNGEVEHTRYPVEPALHLPRRLDMHAGLRWADERTFVRDMKNLALLYTWDAKDERMMQPIIEAGESIFGSDVTSFSQEMEAEATAYATMSASILNIGSYMFADAGTGIDSTSYQSFFVNAVEFHSTGLATSAETKQAVLAFRGTYSMGDYGMVKYMIANSVVSPTSNGLTQKMKTNWETIAGLNWTDAIAAASQVPDTTARVYGFGSPGSAALALGGIQQTAQGLQRAGVLSEEQVAQVGLTGLWTFTKMIVGAAKAAADAAGETFYLTGHSQGGARAALASMYLEKKDGIKVKTTTFAAPGPACWSRGLAYTTGNYLDDVDPYVTHDQITEYVHVLDYFGNIDVDVGNVCVYGTTDIDTSRAAKYCGEVIGYSATNVIGSGGVAKAMGEAYAADPNNTRAKAAYEFYGGLYPKANRCHYFTHWQAAINHDLDLDTFLNADGSTDGGCSLPAAIPENDSDGKCPEMLTMSPTPALAVPKRKTKTRTRTSRKSRKSKKSKTSSRKSKGSTSARKGKRR